jgi:4,5-DOPA dioxygenase extradiol
MILASGNVVHNLRLVQWDQPDAAFDWAERFDDAVAEQLSREPGEILGLQAHPDFDCAVPTPDHFIPVLYLAGLAAAGGDPVEVLVRGYAMGSISMTCYGLGATGILRQEPECSARLPDGVPPDQTNM